MHTRPTFHVRGLPTAGRFFLLDVWFLGLLLIPVLRLASQTATGPQSTTPDTEAKPASPVVWSEPVTFAQITDPHLFDGGKKRATVQEAVDEQQDNWQAFHWAVVEINRLVAGGAKIDFVVFTGDLGLEFVRRPNEALCRKDTPDTSSCAFRQPAEESPSGIVKALDQDEFEEAKKKGWIKLFSFEEAADRVADEFRLLHVPVVYLLPGNNDLAKEDPCDLKRYQEFVGLLSRALGAHAPRIVDLGSAQPAPEYNGFALLGLNSASFKNDNNYQATCAKGNVAGCPQFEMSRLQDSVGHSSGGSLYLMFTHIPDLKDPYYRTPAWKCLSSSERSSWEEIAAKPSVAGIFAGHFHDPHRVLYATRSDAASLASDSDQVIGQKTWVAPPLALKNQEKSTITARGFLLVRAQKASGATGATASFSVIPFWFQDRADHPWWMALRLWVIVAAVLAILVVILIPMIARRSRRPPVAEGQEPPPAQPPAMSPLTIWWVSAYPAALTILLLLLIALAAWEVLNFAVQRLAVEPFYCLIPIFGAFGGAVGSVLRGDGGVENKVILASVESSFKIRAGIVGDVAIGIGGAVTVVFLFERAFPVQSDSASYALLVSVSFIAGVMGRRVIEIATKKFDEQIVDKRLAQKSEQLRDARQQAIEMKEEARKATNAGNFEQALKLLEAALQTDPKYINAYIEKGRALRRLNRLQEALETLQAALKIEPEHPRVLYNSACYKHLLGFPKAEVLSDLERAIAGEPGLGKLAQNDLDFTTLKTDPYFRKLVGLETTSAPAKPPVPPTDTVP